MRVDYRLTRIVATLGPASATKPVIQKLARAGMNVARLNMSHGDHAFHLRALRNVRRVSKESGIPIGVMVDLQGPKVRLGHFDEPLELVRGEKVALTTDPSDADPERKIVHAEYEQLPLEAAAGHDILIGDGDVRLRVTRVRAPRVWCQVVEGRALVPRAGLHLPQATAQRSALTRKDRKDLKFAIENEADFIALSFVRRAKDLVDTRRLIKRLGGDQLLIGKIETRQAIDQLEEVLAEADAVMVARGDLGIQLPPEQVPLEQKRIIQAAVRSGKPVITATQMLESMRNASRPTRAEASDVANAVWDGTWGLMLSAETATGEFPVETVEMMDRIARAAEGIALKTPRRRSSATALTPSEAVADAASWVAIDVGASALVALTRSGASARQISRFMPPLPTYAYTPSPRALSRMTLYRGIVPRRMSVKRSFTHAVVAVNDDLVKRRELRRGELVVVIGGAPNEPEGVTNRIVVHLLR